MTETGNGRNVRTLLALVILLTCSSTEAYATLLRLDHFGTFTSNSTVGGALIPNGTAFTYSAVFDSTMDLDAFPVLGIFDAVVEFNITGIGVFTSDPAGDVNVVLGGSGPFTSYIVNFALTSGWAVSFTTAAPLFDVDTPAPSALSGYIGSDETFPFIVPLSGGAGNLVVNGLTYGPTAQISAAPSAIPEPASLATTCLGLMGVLWLRRRGIRIRPGKDQ